MLGNFVIGTGAMVVSGTLNDISTSLEVSIPQAGQLITAGAILMGLGAPLFAGIVAGWDRRRLLTLSLPWYALFMGLSALIPSYARLLPLRVWTVITPTVFTPQAAASVGLLVAPAQRGRAFVFLGWSVASVMGMPQSVWIGGAFGLTGNVLGGGLIAQGLMRQLHGFGHGAEPAGRAGSEAFGGQRVLIYFVSRPDGSPQRPWGPASRWATDRSSAGSPWTRATRRRSPRH